MNKFLVFFIYESHLFLVYGFKKVIGFHELRQEWILVINWWECIFIYDVDSSPMADNRSKITW